LQALLYCLHSLGCLKRVLDVVALTHWPEIVARRRYRALASIDEDELRTTLSHESGIDLDAEIKAAGLEADDRMVGEVRDRGTSRAYVVGKLTDPASKQSDWLRRLC
jgi:hypothetical protein